MTPDKDLLISVTVDFDDTIAGFNTNFADFVADNDGLSDAEVAEMRATLQAGRTYHGGGGASPEFTIEPEPEEAP